MMVPFSLCTVQWNVHVNAWLPGGVPNRNSMLLPAFTMLETNVSFR
jgi:hypothetical protein